MEAKQLLKKYWGYDTFRPQQEEIIESVRQGHDTLALLPTGGGKSLCYQLPGLLREGLCLVVSPLIALMKDQVQQLNDRHIKASCIVSGMSGETVTGVLMNAISGQLKFLYVSPERLRSRTFLEYYKRMKVGMIAVDEAHCVSQWGYDFRPPYLQIAEIRPYHPEAPLIALTATATPAVEDDICQRLKMDGCRRFRTSFARANLAYMVLHAGNKNERLLRIVQRVGGSGIVYMRSRRGTQAVALFLESSGVSATFYHAGLDAAERDRRQHLWMKGNCRVMVATNAFGMGIDKPDVRFVVHLDLPDSIEAYFQEAGRAGRDGKASYAVMICDASDVEKLRRDVATEFPPLQTIRNVYRALCNYYKVPMGGGADSRFNFDMEQICFTYNFVVREFYSACRILEREGLISLPSDNDIRSTVYLPASREEVYRFRVDHERLGNVLESVMRMCPGLMECPVPINEKKLAQRLQTNSADVANVLIQLHEMHIIQYNPCPKGPQILFESERIDERLICPSEEHYAMLKEAAERRMEAIKRYVNDDKTCRSRQLLDYFADKGVDCGICDVCRRKNNERRDVRSAVLDLLTKNSLDVQQLVQILTSEGYERVGDEVREMLDRGEVSLVDGMQLRIVS